MPDGPEGVGAIPGIVPALLALLLAGPAAAAPAAAAPAAPAPGDTSRAAPVIPLHLPPDIVYAHGGHADSAVVFSHVTHVAFAENRCTGCHPAAFRMLSRGPAPRHGQMNAGSSCGSCHDGRQAFGVRDTSACGTCHSGARSGKPVAAATGKPGAAAAPPLPKPHTYPPSDASPGSVTFRHKTHPPGLNGCATCHPKPFRMAPTPPLPDGGMHEAQACGSCHDGKKAFATDADAACMRCHHESGGRP